MECLLREMLAVLKVGIGLTNNRLSDSFSGCRNGNVLLTGNCVLKIHHIPKFPSWFIY